jgi:RNA polymerase sigma-70 factor (ECF subfamily)
MELAHEDQFIKRMQKGDERAFEVIMKHYQHRLYSLIIGIVKNDNEAAEVAQDVFMKVFNKAQSFQFNSKFSTWLYSIAYNTSISYVRKKKLAIESIDERKVGVIEHDGFGSLDLLKTEERRKYIEMALDKMGEQQRVLIQLFYLEELSIQEIIDVTGFKLSSVKTGLLRARQNLLKHLNIVLKDEVNSLL